MKCFYHVDADGKCAGHWVNILAERTYVEEEVEFCKINYGLEFPFEDIKENERVYIVDYSIQPDEMRRLLSITSDVTWIDHHITAIDKYKGFEHEIRGVRYSGIAGCMLAYCYLKHMTNGGVGDIKPFEESMTEDAPWYTKYIADRDVWTWEYGELTARFTEGFSVYDNEPTDNVWKWLSSIRSYTVNNIMSEICDKGIVALKYRDNYAKELCQSKGFETELHGHKAYALNAGLCGSEWFKSVDDGTYDILIAFSYNGEHWSVSLYSTSIDTSKISVQYGGGGHSGASGFQCSELPFKKVYKQ